jgi:CubicO group peptidase (beta-lactamase class C family)
MSPKRRMSNVAASLVLLFLCLSAGTGAVAEDKPAAQRADALAALAAGLRPSIVEAGQAMPHWSLQERMTHYGVPGVAVAVIRDGKVVQAAGYGVRHDRAAVDAQTAFSVGSVSKIITAATTLRLVADGRLDLDRDVSGYLDGWRFSAHPDAPGAKVNLRMLLSHTSGFNVHGFEDYPPAAPLPTLLQTLDGALPARNEAVRLIDPPGLRMRYSGGGVQLEQLVLESAADLPFARLAQDTVFSPLGMRRSTFEQPLAPAFGNIAHAHDRDGKPAALPRGWESFPEQAASGLWTSAEDLGTFVAALIESYRGRNDFLPRAIAREMMTEIWPSLHGLGPRLQGEGATRFFHHGGANDSYRAWIEGHLESGNGLVILTNGSRGGQLMMEIRNALTDALDDGINPPIRTLSDPAVRDAYADYMGSYTLDATVPPELRGNLAVLFLSGRARVTQNEQGLRLQVAQDQEEDAAFQLAPLAPGRFIAENGDPDFLRVAFDRDARGQVLGMRVERGTSRLFLRHNVVR